MNNVAGTQPVGLTVFGGAVVEMAPEDLPEGASPFSQDVDFVPGAVFTRGGRQSVYAFNGLFAEDLAGFAVTLPGLFAPNEAPWLAPSRVTQNVPGSYTSVTLNTSPSELDQDATATSASSATVSVSATPSYNPDFAMVFTQQATIGSGYFNPGGSWGVQNTSTNSSVYSQQLSSGNPVTATGGLGSAMSWSSVLALFFSNGAAVVTPLGNIVLNGAAIGFNGSGTSFIAGHTGIICFSADQVNTSSGTQITNITDSQGNKWQRLGSISTPIGAGPGAGTGTCVDVWFAPNMVGGAVTTLTGTFNFALPSGASSDGNVAFFDVSGLITVFANLPHSQQLVGSNFNFNIPAAESVLGVEVEFVGHQTGQPADAILSTQLILPNGSFAPATRTGQLPLVDGTLIFGTPTDTWGAGATLTPALFNNPNFGVSIVASALTPQTFSSYAMKLKVFTSPSPGANFNYIKTYEQTSGQIDTLALDANGLLWDENVTSLPNVLSAIYTGINPGSYAKSVTFDNVEYIALSNLINGTDIPRHWDGTNLDRVSQVGPGAPPSVNATATIFQIAPAPNGITQNPPVIPLHGGGGANGFGFILWSSGPGSTSSGNTITFFYTRLIEAPTPDPNIVVGQGIQIQNSPAINGQPTNGNYIVTSVGSAIPPNGNFSNPRWYFTVTAPTTQSGNFFTPNSGIAGSGYQVTLATLTTLTPLPNTQVGSQIQLAGVGVAAWNATWTVLATPNAAQLAITSTQLSNNVATYTYTLITGVAPTVGQQVTIVGCLNGPIVGGTSIFNISNGIIASTGANQFSIAITAANVLPAPETGNATVNGTKFQFDPGIQYAGQTIVNPIFGNSGGGTVVIGGAGLGAGVRKAVLIFLTRNGLITAPSPPVIFTTTGGSTTLAFSNVLIGPPDVIARIIAITGANGGNFFWIPQPVIIQSNGQNVTYTSTMISDNTSTQATLTFTDAVLLAGTAIDVTGNNLFNQMELGSCRGFLTYANRLIAWGEQNKIQNLLNLSFEGGIGQSASGTTTYPAGWTVDPVNGAGGNLRVSPIFGNSYYILNGTGGVQALYGMIEQGAFQDAYQVAIVQPNTTYSVRVTARCPSGAVTGNLVVDFFSPLQNRIFGSFTIPLGAMTGNFQIFTGTLLTASLSTVPPDLVYRIYASALPNAGDVEVDRTEPFPTLQPVFSTELRASYVNNQEAFDLVTGAFGPAQNQQPVNGAFELFETLYALKEKSMFSTSDTGVSEPNQWNWRTVSPKVGTIGIHSYDAGEGWMVTACRPGAYFFEGGEPIKISQEIQPVWDLINWKYGSTIWFRNDEQLKRLTIGVPIPTPNPYMPEFPLNANPTSPNVILMCSYRELNTGQELAHTGPIRSTFSGRLMSPEPARKWSFWNIACPYADFISRGNENWPEFFCSGYANSKIFQLSSAELDDDGNAINSFYVTYGFVKPEMADAKGLGLFRMELDYLTMLLTGSGSVITQVYPESVQNPLPYQLGQDSLQLFSQGDTEVAVNISGNRFFIRVGTNAVGSAFRLSKVVAALVKDPWSEVRGTAVGSA